MKKLYVFYHIYVNKHKECLDTIKEQLQYIKNSNLFEKVEQIHCCITGSHESNYNFIIDYIKLLPSKFKIEKEKFDDKTYERFTLYEMKRYLREEAYYLYLHSKGVSRIGTDLYTGVNDWRRCMEYFLIENSDKCIEKLDIGYTSVGIFLELKNPSPHYVGNFWWATGKHLIKLFNERQISGHYLGPEMFLLSNFGNPYEMFSFEDLGKRKPGHALYRNTMDRKVYAIYE
jgi:hypothetical protein